MPTNLPKEAVSTDKTHRTIGGLLLLFVLSALLLLGMQGITLYDRFARSAEVGLDNRVWLFAQLEVEAKNFSLAMLEGMAEGGGEPLDPALEASIRSSFDIYYSRTKTVLAVARDSFQDPVLLDRFELLSAKSKGYAERLDAVPRLSAADLPALHAAFSMDLTDIRRVANSAMLDSITIAESTRETRRRIIGQLQLLLGLVIVLMVASVRQAMKVSRSVGHHAAETAKVAARLRRTLNTSLDAVLIVDAAGRITEHNAALRSILGNPSSGTITGRQAVDFLARKDRKAVLNLVAELRSSAPLDTTETGTARRINVNLRLEDGTLRPVELSCAVDQSRPGRFSFIVFIRDRSQEVAAADVLRDARDQARLDAKAKERFLSVLSHEMRTPLHGVITALELVRLTELKADQQGYVQTAASCARSAMTQIVDVLALTRNGYLGDPDEPFVPAVLVQSIVSEIMPLALDRGNLMACHVSGDARSDAILAKHRSFKLAARNLISNAVKYTSRGRIDIRLVAQTLDTGAISVELSVNDTGLGIDPRDHARIFDEFAMVAEKGADENTGFGLGLAIAKSSVERLNGQIGVDSQPGRGSTFYFAFEAPKAAPTEPTPVPVAPDQSETATLDRPKQVLIVDDNPVNRTLLCEMVKRLGHGAHLAQDGKTAVKLASERPFDLILMDLSMPGMNGFDTARLIRSEGRNGATRIVALSARDMVECADDLRDAGIDDAFQKPIGISQLHRLMTEVAPQVGVAPPSSAVPVLDGFQDVRDLLGAEMTSRLERAMLQDATLAIQALCAAVPNLTHASDLGDLAHRASGSAAVLGAARLAEVWRSVETSVTSNNQQALCKLAEQAPVVYGETVSALQRHSLPGAEHSSAQGSDPGESRPSPDRVRPDPGITPGTCPPPDMPHRPDPRSKKYRVPRAGPG